MMKAFASVPDPRSKHGRRHPLPAILALSVAAMLCGAKSLYAIAQWGREQKPEVVKALGFRRDKTLAVSTLHAVFSKLDVVAFEASLQNWAQDSTMAVERERSPSTARDYGGYMVRNCQG